jgi:DNA-binding transcriptional MerR regulator
VHGLQLIKRGRELGFSMAEIAELVGLCHNRQRASVKRIAQQHVDKLAPPDIFQRWLETLAFRNEVLGLFAARMAAALLGRELAST